MVDAYHTLGVERGCSREEVMAAFRAKVWHAHPDRGGDEQAFIQLCSAYKKILKEVRRIESKGKPAPAARDTRPPRRPTPKETRKPTPSRKSNHDAGRSKSTDATWKPDLILAADVGRNGQPAPPPDPTWSPDLILAEETSANSRREQPPDPNWDPDVVLRDGSVDRDARNKVRDPLGAPETYRSLFGRISARSTHEENVVSVVVTAFLKAVLVLVSVVWTVFIVWHIVVAWNETVEAARQAEAAKYR